MTTISNISLGIRTARSHGKSSPAKIFKGKPYFARPAQNPQAFAVRVGERWAGSFSTLSRMNKKIPMKIGPDWYSLGLIHEIFHAYQAESAPEEFSAARASTALESRYPFDDGGFAARLGRGRRGLVAGA